MIDLLNGIFASIKERAIAKGAVLFLGVDGAGKSTIIDKLLCHAKPDRRPKKIRPTMGLYTELVEDRHHALRIWDLGGKPAFRNTWRDYLKDATALVYVVSAQQRERIHETRKLFDDITLGFNKPIAVVFNAGDEELLELFPPANNLPHFFVDTSKPEDISSLYEWILSTLVV